MDSSESTQELGRNRPAIGQAAAAIRQSADRFPAWFETRDGQILTMRLIRPDDAQLLIEFAHRLSPESRQRRFHQNLEHLSEQAIQELAHQLSDVDNRTRGGAILAVAEDPAGEPQVVGVARLGRPQNKPESPTAEAAIVVRDDYQGQGVGSELLRRMVHLARRMGVEQVIAYVQVDNAPVIRLVRRLGLPVATEISRGLMTIAIEMPE